MENLKDLKDLKDPKVSVKISEVHVQAGEVVTIWLGDYSDPGGPSQVELHVTEDGERRVLLEDKSMVKSFDEVYAASSSGVPFRRYK
jgi:hypothetical protein